MHESFNVWVKKNHTLQIWVLGWGYSTLSTTIQFRKEKMLVHITRRKMSGRFFFVLRHYLYSLSIQNLVQHIFIYIYCTDFFCCGTAASTVSDFNELQRTRPTRLDAAPNKMASINPPRFRRRLLFSIMYSTTCFLTNSTNLLSSLPRKQQTDFLF